MSMCSSVRSFLLRIRCELSEWFSLGKGFEEKLTKATRRAKIVLLALVWFFLKEKVTTPHGSVSPNSQYFIELH